jgi:hypothetical protein
VRRCGSPLPLSHGARRFLSCYPASTPRVELGRVDNCSDVDQSVIVMRRDEATTLYLLIDSEETTPISYAFRRSFAFLRTPPVLSGQVEALCADNRRLEGLRAAAAAEAAAAEADQAAVVRNLDASIAREAAARFEVTKAKDEVQTLTIYIKGQVCADARYIRYATQVAGAIVTVPTASHQAPIPSLLLASHRLQKTHHIRCSLRLPYRLRRQKYTFSGQLVG